MHTAVTFFKATLSLYRDGFKHCRVTHTHSMYILHDVLTCFAAKPLDNVSRWSLLRHIHCTYYSGGPSRWVAPVFFSHSWCCCICQSKKSLLGRSGNPVFMNIVAAKPHSSWDKQPHLLLLCSLASFTKHTEDWEPALRMYRGVFLVILCTFLLGINTYGWRSSGVNHVLIFELDPRDHLTHQQLLEVCS